MNTKYVDWGIFQIIEATALLMMTNSDTCFECKTLPASEYSFFVLAASHRS